MDTPDAVKASYLTEVRGLKLMNDIALEIAFKSYLTEVRGLKWNLALISQLRQVVPHRGTWIEISGFLTFFVAVSRTSQRYVD